MATNAREMLAAKLLGYWSNYVLRWCGIVSREECCVVIAEALPKVLIERVAHVAVQLGCRHYDVNSGLPQNTVDTRKSQVVVQRCGLYTAHSTSISDVQNLV